MEIINCQSNIIPKGFAIRKYSSCAFGNEHTLYLHPKKMTMMRMSGFPAPCWLHLCRAPGCCRAPQGDEGFGQRPPPRQLLLWSHSLQAYSLWWPSTNMHSPSFFVYFVKPGLHRPAGGDPWWQQKVCALRACPSCSPPHLACTKPTRASTMGQISLGQLTPQKPGAACCLEAALWELFPSLCSLFLPWVIMSMGTCSAAFFLKCSLYNKQLRQRFQ